MATSWSALIAKSGKRRVPFLVVDNRSQSDFCCCVFFVCRGACETDHCERSEGQGGRPRQSGSSPTALYPHKLPLDCLASTCITHHVLWCQFYGMMMEMAKKCSSEQLANLFKEGVLLKPPAPAKKKRARSASVVQDLDATHDEVSTRSSTRSAFHDARLFARRISSTQKRQRRQGAGGR